MFEGLLKALGIYELLPQGPVLTPWERTRGWLREAPSGARYTGGACGLEGAPLVPLMVFGVGYELDLVIVTNHPVWNMHEYAMLRTSQGPMWIAKDAREADRSQSIVAELDDLEGWFPELPVPRARGELVVEDRSDARKVEVGLSYVNPDGERVEVEYAGAPPVRVEPKRNGSTMGHSRSQLMAVLDLSHKAFGRRSVVRYDGRARSPKRILGLVPFHMALRQVQGGLCAGRYRVEAGDEGGFVTRHRLWHDRVASQAWSVREVGEAVVASQETAERGLHYRFVRGEDGASLEWVSATATQWGRGAATFHMALNPALPDLRRRFEGVASSRYTIDVNGQCDHAVGRLEAVWGEDAQGRPQVKVSVVPERPWWTTDRPMVSAVVWDEGGAEVSVRMVG